MHCVLCSEKNADPEHFNSEKHIKNKILHDYSSNKQLAENRSGIVVSCNAQSSYQSVKNSVEQKIMISTKPNEQVTMKFKILNNNQKGNIHVTFVQMLHSKFNFILNNHGLNVGCKPLSILPKKQMKNEITVTFKSSDIGQYEAPIVFLFRNNATNENVIIMRDMVVYVQEIQTVHGNDKSPYMLSSVMADQLYRTNVYNSSSHGDFRVSKAYKKIFATGLQVNEDAPESEKKMANELKEIFNIKVTVDNYVRYFHCLLWYEETIVRINLKKYNLSGVAVSNHGNTFSFRVPGLAEKRPSLLIGDLVFLKPHHTDEVMFEAVISDIQENTASIKGLHSAFYDYYKPDMKFDVRFFMSRIPLVRMHSAVHSALEVGQSRIFPRKKTSPVQPQPILDFYNPAVGGNPEQRAVVENVVAGTSGDAPFLLHGPPGTGKTVTIVEAVLQLVKKNQNNRIMICTDSNMAADNVATMLIKYAHMFPKDDFLLRSNSECRSWESMPECLINYSNGKNRGTYYNVNISSFMKYRIVITTLSHAAKFANELKRKKYTRYMTHVFIDEAAQSSEPASLIPVVGLLAAGGGLVLAGDPLQLGPVVISHGARGHGLGTSLMERLKNECPLYSDEVNDPHYIVMLRNNFRSNQVILELPNELFYKGQLRPFAPVDNLSFIDIMGERRQSCAIMFHGVLSEELRVGKSPSFFNLMEVEIVQMYVTELIKKHEVEQKDIGIVTPYIRQVYHIKKWLKNTGYNNIEVGTVEAYQGKEKRVIIISTVRANCGLLDHDAKFQLGFLVDDKRFNVALTRAKAKTIIIGNPLCLQMDVKWRMYMQKCRDLGTYFGVDWENANEVSREFIDTMVPLLQQFENMNVTTEKTAA